MNEAAVGHWLSIIGVGAGGVDTLTAEAATLVGAASLLVGGARHLALLGPLAPAAEQLRWSRPIADTFPLLLARRPAPVVVLASGDPFLHGVGSLLAPLVPLHERRTVPAPSSVSLAAAVLGWALQDVSLVSLCGRPLATIVPFLQPGRRVLALSDGADTPAAVAALLCRRGGGHSTLHVLERLGAPDARVRAWDARAFPPELAVDPLNLVAITVDPDIAAVPLGAGLDDAFFDHDGQITAPELRAMALAALAPRRGECLWDIGAGAGSIAIEWTLRDPLAMHAVAFERDEARVARIRANALTLGTPGVRVVGGEAPDSFDAEELPAPHAVFVGGGGGRPGLLDAAWSRLQPGGRLVAHSVTLETDAALAAAEARHGGGLTRVAIERAGPIGAYRAFRPSMTVTQWNATKP